jgi:hypothetical protein
MYSNMEKKMTRSEFKRKMQQINNHFNRIEDIFNSLSNGIQQEVQEYHNEECSIGHCTRWGLQASADLYKDARRFLKKAEENGSI